LDDAGNRLRRWLLRYRVPDILRQDPSYPKIQWNAFGATGKTPGSWDPVEKKYYPLIDDIAPLGFEEVMIDVGWWQAGEPDSDRADWPSGMMKAADYAHQKAWFGSIGRTTWTWPAPPDAASGRIAARLFRSPCRCGVPTHAGEVIASSYARPRVL
jgi:hypothetical protein